MDTGKKTVCFCVMLFYLLLFYRYQRKFEVWTNSYYFSDLFLLYVLDRRSSIILGADVFIRVYSPCKIQFAACCCSTSLF